MNLLYLDLATRTGWAAGDVRGKPSFGCEQLPKASEESLGMLGVYYEDFFYRMLGDYMPDRVVFEKPFINPRRVKIQTTSVLVGLCFVTQIICEREDIPVSSCDHRDVKTWALGTWSPPASLSQYKRQKTWKAAMIEQARERGHRVEDDNEADAVLGWEREAHRLWPELTDHLQSWHDINEPRMEGV